MTTAAPATGRPAARSGRVGQAPRSPLVPPPASCLDDRRVLRGVDWGASSSAAFYRSLEDALERLIEYDTLASMPGS
ncbi:hypothetical protein [Marinitenerispora sediminis]|uniref:Uncharacterized protein n=1 Tax=Marinitenerispora sediminis TaxID=1931232 RepID=A0A368TB68_9ACTN|nr:hypothetical protein [Marinitenerispora sediminis]RCV51350.1 hypothetical protein DEF28_15615 [Marinitenerispora sediminis]RCV57178.1 hypothetical protein DEF23_11190 [Marinitenerispora sediminis]RCV60315.1 hypothetical protein DEF24_07510 [Marinitenerispora sediminis]